MKSKKPEPKKHIRGFACKTLKQAKEGSKIFYTDDPEEVTCLYCKAELWDRMIKSSKRLAG